MQQYASEALSLFSYYANINFSYVGYFQNATAAYNAGADIDISLSASTSLFPSSSIWALGYFPIKSGENVYVGQAGDVYLNIRSAANNLPSYEPGSAGWFVLLHELGHTLGLKHTHDDGGSGRPIFTSIQSVLPDSDWVSMMSYKDDFASDLIRYDPASPMILDVIGIQALYGINRSTNLGTTTFPLDSSDSFYYTVWDAGGEADLMDASASPGGWEIVLPDFQESTLVPERFGWAVPLGDLTLSSPRTFVWLEGDIENATGSRFADEIYGSDLRNAIKGGGGNDFLDGGADLDRVIQTGSRPQYQITKTTTGLTISDSVQGRDGTDTLQNVERIQFADGTLAFDIAGDAGQAYRLYQAALARTPDVGGLKFHTSALDSGQSLIQVAANFIGSQEFQAKYGTPASVSDAQFVTLLYQNVLHRAPDAGGFSYHTGNLAHGLSRAELLTQFSESPENQASVIGAIQNGIWLGA